MVTVLLDPPFQKLFAKIKDNRVKEQILKQIAKIAENPEIGKPMRFSRKGTRELYIKPFRLSYRYIYEENQILILDLFHKDKQ